MRRHLVFAAGLSAIFFAGLGLSAAYAGPLTLAAQNASGASVAPFTLLGIPNSSVSMPTSSGQPSVTLSDGSVVTSSQNSGTSPYAGTYSGNIQNVAASPFNGTNLSRSNYLVAQPSDSITIAYNSLQQSFDLLWGSVDSYNSIVIQFCGTTTCSSLDTIVGQDVANAAGIVANGVASAFVELSDAVPFDHVKIQTTGIAFEFVPAVPEPVTLSILGTGLVGLGMVKRRRQQSAKQ